jgi:hypothetical protein
MGRAVDLGFQITDLLDLMHKLVSNFKILGEGEKLVRGFGEEEELAVWEKIGGPSDGGTRSVFLFYIGR